MPREPDAQAASMQGLEERSDLRMKKLQLTMISEEHTAALIKLENCEGDTKIVHYGNLF